MKKSKLTLGIVASLLSVGALAACNEVTYSDGVVLEYTDAQGQSMKITAEELFGDQSSTSVASTDFDSVYEVLIRKYYQSGNGSKSRAELESLAAKEVENIKDQAKKNADANKTSYQQEFSTLLANNNVENVDELYQAKLYEQEKKRFESDYETDESVIAMRDGTQGIFRKSDAYGEGSDGYLAEQMPYTVSHILVKLASASNGEHAEATISESESRKLGQVIELLAGAETKGDGKTVANVRTDFGVIAQQESEDTGSAEKYGQLDVMDRDQADSFINEFKFGIYAYEAIYNQMNVGKDGEGNYNNPYAAEPHLHANSGETYALASKIKFSDEATYTDKSVAQTDEEAAALAEGEHYIKNYFATAAKEIGRIPYGAAVALASESVSKNKFTVSDGLETKEMSWEVNGNSATFFPRNILFNKYFNNHRVAVIVPNEIPYNDPLIENVSGGDYTTENFVGQISDAYAALPGFSFNTKDALPASILGQDTNVLTTEKGQIILAVRGGSSGSYEGIHFMVIDRSALDEFVEIDSNYIPSRKTAEYYEENKGTKNITSLSEFYTISTPNEAAYPTYNTGVLDEPEPKKTYINQLDDKDNYSNVRKAIKEKISSYNTNKDTYMFQTLIEDEHVSFADNAIALKAKNLIQNWIKSKRHKSLIDRTESFDDTWATYIEYLTAQNEARALKADGSQRLISETCAIGYNKSNSNPKDPATLDSIWKIGGACYAK
ncbi:MAG: peptidyl-prolyl cis-trans isomerase [Bacilli bacterium]|nr:peptidyl-prolyl cis-trans isomerase [Bacilli bacterium]